MIPEAVLAFTWGGFVWGFLSFVVFAVSVLLAVVILVQDSKETGLTSAFGGGGGGSALLGARMQKDLAKITTILAIVLAVCLMIMSLLTQSMRASTYGTAPPLETPSSASESGPAPGGDLEGTSSPVPAEQGSPGPGE